MTVAVATYNSAEFIVETLDSIAAQTYPHIELIVSDDCSADNTVAVCREWMEQHQDRFIRAFVITVPSNTGVSANANRSFRASGSEWIKLLGGDDILLPNCIAANVNYIRNNPGVSAVLSQVLLYKNDFRPASLLRAVPAAFPDNIMRDELTAADQYKLLLLSDRINYTPSVFLHRQSVLSVGGFDESIPMMEDYPMWLKLTSSGHRLRYFHEPTVGYRQHERAINNMENQRLFKPNYLKSGVVKDKYVYPNLPWDIALGERFVFRVSVAFQQLGLNRPGAAYQFLYRGITNYMNPFRYVTFFKRKVLAYGKHDLFYR